MRALSQGYVNTWRTGGLKSVTQALFFRRRWQLQALQGEIPPAAFCALRLCWEWSIGNTYADGEPF
jgi:hypothetical protein